MIGSWRCLISTRPPDRTGKIAEQGHHDLSHDRQGFQPAHPIEQGFCRRGGTPHRLTASATIVISQQVDKFPERTRPLANYAYYPSVDCSPQVDKLAWWRAMREGTTWRQHQPCARHRSEQQLQLQLIGRIRRLIPWTIVTAVTDGNRHAVHVANLAAWRLLLPVALSMASRFSGTHHRPPTAADFMT